MIVYKVVRKNRTSAIVGRLKDYSIKYPVGKIVSGKKGTFGIFCFETFNQAFSFHYDNIDKCMILKVRPIGKKIEVSDIGHWHRSESITNFYKKQKNKKMFISRYKAPSGTVCYQKVKVLD